MVLDRHKEGDTFFHFGTSFSEGVKDFSLEDSLFLVDRCVYDMYSDRFEGKKLCILSAGEEEKDWKSCDPVIRSLVVEGIDRGGRLIVVGGGSLTDLGSFVASIYLRGIEIVLVPTTLLCMVDASVGGKNGINFLGYKNILGRINLPSSIIWDLSFLESLPLEEWSCGFSEIIKYGCLFSHNLWDDLLERGGIDFYRHHPGVLEALIEDCVGFKDQIVREDLNERGSRRFLNFGHTLGHAIELSLGLPHGEAVAWGMCFAMWLSVRETGLSVDYLEKLPVLLKSYGLLRTPIDRIVGANIEGIRQDKKRDGGRIHYILLEDIGKAISVSLSFREIEKAWLEFIHNFPSLIVKGAQY
ncbi:MAG: 3-dehydroquinate synthase [Cytophagales bacterium]|nr:3-dehydroquinate synthase [Cytophagales bacterium]